jgi:hypothetical protein
MEDIRSVLTKFPEKNKQDHKDSSHFDQVPTPTVSEIPDVFFDVVLTKLKLSRQEITTLMYLYRYTWCRPNLYRSHGIGPIHSYSEMSRDLFLSQDELIQILRHLETLGLLQTIRAGQYFIRKYFIEDLDLRYGQTYEF